MFPYTDKSMIIYAYLITYNITFVGWIILHGINMPHHIFIIYESQFFHYNDAKACNYFLKFLEVFLSM